MRRTQKNRKFIIVAMILLLLISVGYAALSTTLTINGTANISAASWNVYFTNIQTTNGSVIPTVAPTVSGTSTVTLNYTVTLEAPGDFYEFTVDVKNGGTINAKIATDGISNTTLTTAQDALVNYTVTYSNGDAIQVGDKLSKSGATISGIGDTRTIKVRVEYDPNVTAAQLNAMNGEDITLDLEFSLTYVQD